MEFQPKDPMKWQTRARYNPFSYILIPKLIRVMLKAEIILDVCKVMDHINAFTFYSVS